MGNRHSNLHNQKRNDLWNLPVPKRTQEVADIAKTLLGPNEVLASISIGKEEVHLTITVRKARVLPPSRLNMELVLRIAENALAMDSTSMAYKGVDLVVKLAAPLSAAQNAEVEAARREAGKWKAAVLSTGLFCFAVAQFGRAVHMLYQNKCTRVWEEYMQLADFYTFPCKRNMKNLLWSMGCSTMLVAWLSKACSRKPGSLLHRR